MNALQTVQGTAWLKYTGVTNIASLLSRDRMPNIPYNTHMFMFSWDPTLGFHAVSGTREVSGILTWG